MYEFSSQSTTSNKKYCIKLRTRIRTFVVASGARLQVIAIAHGPQRNNNNNNNRASGET